MRNNQNPSIIKLALKKNPNVFGFSSYLFILDVKIKKRYYEETNYYLWLLPA